MAKKVKVVLNKAEVRSQLLRSQVMANYLQELAGGISDRCGKGYSTDVHFGKNRVNVAVTTASNEAASDNLKNNTILRNLK